MQLSRATTDRRRIKRPYEGAERFEFSHGLGDACMFRSMLKHIDSPIELFVPDECGYRVLFEGLRNVKVVERPQPGPKYYRLRFYPEDHDYQPEFGTKCKPRICLEKEFRVKRDGIVISPEPVDLSALPVTDQVSETLERLERLGPYVVVHAQGLSNARNAPKQSTVYEICDEIRQAGMTALILNYKYSNSRFQGSSDFWFAGLSGIVSTHSWPVSVECMWAAIYYARAFVGMDSGPLHLALTIQSRFGYLDPVPCAFVKVYLDFMTLFYEGGLDAIKQVIDEKHDSTEEMRRKVRLLIE